MLSRQQVIGPKTRDSEWSSLDEDVRTVMRAVVVLRGNAEAGAARGLSDDALWVAFKGVGTKKLAELLINAIKETKANLSFGDWHALTGGVVFDSPTYPAGTSLLEIDLAAMRHGLVGGAEEFLRRVHQLPVAQHWKIR